MDLAAPPSDVPAMRAERQRLLVAIDNSQDANSIAIWLRRIDKIEERFSNAGLNSTGYPRNKQS